MEQSHQDESIPNGKLADLIKKVMHGRRTQPETTGTIEDNAGKKPDILITAKGRSPVVIEAKYMHVPEIEVEKQADWYVCEERNVRGQTHPIEAAIAVRYPSELAQADDMEEALEVCQLSYCALYPNNDRFPTTGWLKGSVSDLADLIDLVAVPRSAFDKTAKDLSNSIDSAVSVLQFSSAYHLTDKIFDTLGLAGVIQTKDLPEKERLEHKNTQTRRIIGAIIANALIFHERIAGAHQHILPINQICGHPVYSSKKAALKAWESILDINYWPVFDTAREIIGLLPAHKASSILKTLTNAAERIHEDGLLYEHDLTGHVFQNLIVDRKYLAAFYTLPTSAALLARLAVSKMKDIDWSDKEAIGKLKIADFACGTGALLSAVYDQIANRHERTAGNPAKLHQAMMEQVLYGFDVLPYAAHLTASILSGKEPAIPYKKSRIYTMPYGRQKDGTVEIGSLEFLDKAEQEVLFHTGDPAKQVGSKVEATIPEVEVQNNSLNLVIMNPPFTRPTNHEGEHADIINPAVAAFGASGEDMDEMGERLKTLGKGTCWHGNAGIASAFVAIANKKLKPGGILALVLPLTAAAGSSWQNLRTLLAKDYTEVEVVSLATPKCYNVAFSADTSMADCLIIARKKSASISSQDSCATRFISLLQRPDNFAAAGETAKQLTAEKTKRGLEDGPFGGDEVFCGKEKMGETIQANIQRKNPKWNLVRIHDFELVQTAYQLTQSKLWLPKCKAKPLAITELKNVGKRGLLSRDINGPAPRIRPDKPNPTRLPRGPFDLIDSTPKPTDTYPTLWNHDAKKETRLICKPDKKLLARPRMGKKANEIWHRIAGRCHFNLNFTLGSQPLAVAFTEEPCIGGDAWPNVNFPKKSWDYAFALWGNSTLGLLCHWWHANRQQPGRSRVSLTSAETLPVLDFRALSQAQIKQAKAIFDKFKRRSFRPAYRADVDDTRAELDRAVLCDWLGFGESIFKAVRQLAKKWCAEPSVHGGKQRPE